MAIANFKSLDFNNLLKGLHVKALSLLPSMAIFMAIFMAFSVCVLVCTFGFSAPVWANIQVKLTDITYEPCQGEVGKNMVLGGGVMSAKCYTVKGNANNTSGKLVYNADVFGRIYDANGNDAMPERARLGALEQIPTGKSEFQIMIAIPAEQPEPLELKQFKASGFAGKVRR